MILHQLWPFQANLDRCRTSSTSRERCPWDLLLCSKFNNFGTIFYAANFMSKTSVKIAWHEPHDMSTLLATSLIVSQRLYKIIFSTASTFSAIADMLGRPGRALPVTLLEPLIPKLNLCSAHSRLVKRHS